MNKHTPGKWTVGYLFHPETIVAQYVLTTLPKDQAEVRANARLMEAAPDMLKALKHEVLRRNHRIKDCYTDDYSGLCVCGIDQMKAVIAKAEGSTNGT